MLAVAFDTLKLARKLESAGMQPKQAQDTSEALSESFTEWMSIGNIATRDDVHEVKAELKTEMGKLEAKIDNSVHDLRGEIKAGLSETKAEILKWMLGQTFLILTALFGLFGLMHH